MRKKSKKNSKTTPTMIENAPFENLFEIFDADARNNIIETMFRDRINLIEQYSRQEINSFQVSKILGIKGRIIASSNYIETCDQKKTEFQAGIKELSEEIKELRQAVELLEKRILKLDEIQKNYQKYLEGQNNELKDEKEFSKKINTVALVHPTCSVKELTYYGFSIIHVTKQDRRIFKLIRPDEIFEFSESDSLIVLPQYYSDYLKEHYDSSAERSIIAYCEMVAHRKIEMDKDVNIVTLFNNEDIQKILEINGLM